MVVKKTKNMTWKEFLHSLVDYRKFENFLVKLIFSCRTSNIQNNSTSRYLNMALEWGNVTYRLPFFHNILWDIGLFIWPYMLQICVHLGYIFFEQKYMYCQSQLSGSHKFIYFHNKTSNQVLFTPQNI